MTYQPLKLTDTAPANAELDARVQQLQRHGVSYADALPRAEEEIALMRSGHAPRELIVEFTAEKLFAEDSVIKALSATQGFDAAFAVARERATLMHPLDTPAP